LRLIRPVSATAATAEPGYTWGLKALGVDTLHQQGITGKGVLVGHLDTGVDASHPALAGVVKVFAEFDSLGNLVPGATPSDSGEHGTHTAGTIAAQPVQGVRFGVAPGAQLASAMVIEGGNVLARILGGLNWVVGQKARVVSMSLGLPGTSDAFLAITRILRARGVLPVFAVGNEGPGTSRYPGNYSEALSVGAMGSAGNVADFSSSQRFKRKKDPVVPDLLGSGVAVISCVPGGKYMQMSGTSMATPHIAGLAALLMEAKPNKTIDQIEAAIFASCTLKPGMLASRANRGFPNAVKALGLV
jgi:subtilisin family serine protease